MKKLCRSRGTVHPSPPAVTDHLAFLPACLLALAASLSPDDLEVLAYLITANSADGGTTPAPPSKKGSRKNPSPVAKPSGRGRGAGSCSVFGGGGGGKGRDDGDHDPNFCCDCFRCYMSYWVRWDKSPNRQLIDEIIDAYEAGLARDRSSSGSNGRGGRGRKDRRKGRGSEAAAATDSPTGLGGGELKDTEVEGSERDEGHDEAAGDDGADEADKGSVRKLVSFIGERIWGVWN